MCIPEWNGFRRQNLKFRTAGPGKNRRIEVQNPTELRTDHEDGNLVLGSDVVVAPRVVDPVVVVVDLVAVEILIRVVFVCACEVLEGEAEHTPIDRWITNPEKNKFTDSNSCIKDLVSA